MNANPVHITTIDIEGRTFKIRKFPAKTGFKVSKMLLSKVLPVLNGFGPLIDKISSGSSVDADMTEQMVMQSLKELISLEGISRALDLVSEQDMDFIVEKSLQQCCEILDGGRLAPVLNPDGTYGVVGLEFDMIVNMRLVCEAVLWGLGDFFDASRLVSLLKPLSSSMKRNQSTSTDTFMPQ